MSIKDGIIHFYGSKVGRIKDGKAIVESRFRCGELYDGLVTAGYTVEWI